MNNLSSRHATYGRVSPDRRLSFVRRCAFSTSSASFFYFICFTLHNFQYFLSTNFDPIRRFTLASGPRYSGLSRFVVKRLYCSTTEDQASVLPTCPYTTRRPRPSSNFSAAQLLLPRRTCEGARSHRGDDREDNSISLFPLKPCGELPEIRLRGRL